MTQHETTGRHWPATAVHTDERGWELLRWPGQWSKMMVHPDHRAPDESHPHYEEPLHTDNGGLMLFVQYQGPTTGGRPIYEGRFNMTARKRIEEENVEV